MGSEKYKAGVLRGLALSHTAIGYGGWPEEIPGLGAGRGGQPFSPCLACPDATPNRNPEAPRLPMWTFVKYGEAGVCGLCVRILARGEGGAYEEAMARVRFNLEQQGEREP